MKFFQLSTTNQKKLKLQKLLSKNRMAVVAAEAVAKYLIYPVSGLHTAYRIFYLTAYLL